jgi:hypothetical protein
VAAELIMRIRALQWKWAHTLLQCTALLTALHRAKKLADGLTKCSSADKSFPAIYSANDKSFPAIDSANFQTEDELKRHCLHKGVVRTVVVEHHVFTGFVQMRLENW